MIEVPEKLVELFSPFEPVLAKEGIDLREQLRKDDILVLGSDGRSFGLGETILINDEFAELVRKAIGQNGQDECLPAKKYGIVLSLGAYSSVASRFPYNASGVRHMAVEHLLGDIHRTLKHGGIHLVIDWAYPPASSYYNFRLRQTSKNSSLLIK